MARGTAALHGAPPVALSLRESVRGHSTPYPFEPVDIEIEVDEDETVLDAAFRQGIH